MSGETEYTNIVRKCIEIKMLQNDIKMHGKKKKTE